MLYRNGKEIEQIFRNGREIALLYKNGEIIYDKRAHETPSGQYRIRYVNGETSQAITGNLPESEYISTNTYTIPSTGTLSWSEHTLLGYSETQYPSYANIATSVYAPGDEITVDHNITLYPVWSTTFQGLINEGFVELGTDPGGATSHVLLFVKPNHYPKELVTDFMDVFLASSSNYWVSRTSDTTGTVGAGSVASTFGFWKESHLNNHWLTTHEWWQLFNNTTLPIWPVSFQFRWIDWSDEESIHMKVNGNSGRYNTMTHVIGKYSPTESVTYELLNGYFGTTTNIMFGFQNQNAGTSYNTGCAAKEINLISKTGTTNTVSGMNGTFMGCRTLKEVHGIDVSNCTTFQYAFDGCYDIEEIPSSDFGNQWTLTGSAQQTFAHCDKLETIEPILDVSGVTNTYCMFSPRKVNNVIQTTELTNLLLKGINANVNNSTTINDGYFIWNYVWDFTNTKLSQNSVNYMVQYLTEITIDDPSTFQYKTIGFPSNVILSSSQITRLSDNGWIAYQNGNILTAIQ